MIFILLSILYRYETQMVYYDVLYMKFFYIYYSILYKSKYEKELNFYKIFII